MGKMMRIVQVNAGTGWSYWRETHSNAETAWEVAESYAAQCEGDAAVRVRILDGRQVVDEMSVEIHDGEIV